ncbi:MAG: 23S rRNA (adenine(2503)-C(2))-methyltransferase RlmN [Tidjanibacter sp.]|nr:23S rRNA (adenine(2503)-C(2))-methyltransferase RlmN [Tidjanibacter sp.]
MESIYGKNIAELKAVAAEAGLPAFAAKQLADWMYKKGATSFDQMTNISLAGRKALAEKFTLGLSAPIHVSESSDGTRKYIYVAEGGQRIESAYIPDGDRATLCISSQKGCKMGCKFCFTGRGGFHGQLTTCEILNQIASLPERDKLTNIVLMGMGEPLDNTDNVLRALEVMTSEWGYGWSPTRITLSTVGVVPNLKRFLDESQCHLAVSLHNPFSDQRREIMPVEAAYPIREVVSLLKQYDFTHQRRVSFEYIVLKGMNDSPEHIKELCRLLDGLKCRINLIRFHAIPDSPYVSPDGDKMTRFRDTLTKKGIMTTIRASRGEDIKAACGLLSGQGDRTKTDNQQ